MKAHKTNKTTFYYNPARDEILMYVHSDEFGWYGLYNESGPISVVFQQKNRNYIKQVFLKKLVKLG